VQTPDNQLVLSTILRAGLPFHQGFLSYFDGAENAFVSAYRKYKDTLKFDIHIEYIASPRIDGKTLIITDPMLATGSSMELSYHADEGASGGNTCSFHYCQPSGCGTHC
jgi:uracil phosphoribosyltransferase